MAELSVNTGNVISTDVKAISEILVADRLKMRC